MNEKNTIISVNKEVDVINYDIDNIKNLIYTIRGKQVMLDSDIAINVSIQIMKAFIEMRNFLFHNGQVFQEINTMKSKLLEHDEKFDIVFDELQSKKEFNQRIFFDGQIYDSYSLVIDIIKTARKKQK